MNTPPTLRLTLTPVCSYWEALSKVPLLRWIFSSVGGIPIKMLGGTSLSAENQYDRQSVKDMYAEVRGACGSRPAGRAHRVHDDPADLTLDGRTLSLQYEKVHPHGIGGLFGNDGSFLEASPVDLDWREVLNLLISR
jgi:hypothetical protein